MKEAIITKLGIIPIGQQFIEELGIVELIDSHVESGNEEILHGKVVNVLLLNLLDNPRPLYQVSDWLSCLLYTSPSPRDGLLSRMPSSA